jgi:hypothetical protein
VPVGEFAIDHAIVEQVLGRKSYYRGKAQEIQALWAGSRDEVVESQKRDIIEFVRQTGLDLVCVHMVPARNAIFEKPRRLDDRTWEDRCGNILRYSEVTHDIMLLERGSHPENAIEQPPPDGSEWELFDHVVKELGSTHYIVARGAGGAPTISYFTALNVEQQLLDIVEHPEKVRLARLRRGEAAGAQARRALDRGADACFFGEDLGFNDGPFMSPAHFRELFVPGLRLQCENAHREGCPVFVHACGNLRPILGMMVDAGIDVYQAIQMYEQIDEYKRAYGDRVTLMGGVDVHTLATGTTDDVRREVRFALQHCAPGGGFILSSSHSLGVATRYDNLMAMLDTVYQEGAYRG